MKKKRWSREGPKANGQNIGKMGIQMWILMVQKVKKNSNKYGSKMDLTGIQKIGLNFAQQNVQNWALEMEY